MNSEQGTMNKERNEMNSDLDSRILFCDSNCVVVNKIAGEACEGAGKGMVDLPQLLLTTLNAQSATSHNAALPVAVNRIDVPVSGCALFARNGAALSFLSTMFHSDAVKKYYWAITEIPKDNERFSENTANSVDLIHWIQFDSKRNKSIAHSQPGPGRKKAILRYRLAGKGRDYLFLEIELISGRHHQIRAQFEQLGIHIKGDLKYGARRSEKNGGIRLHARSLSFPDPAGNSNRINVEAIPPLRDNLWLAFEDAYAQYRHHLYQIPDGA
jgi:23S rRNA pseudouridine1911/1915/1917 synthase